MLTIRKFAQLAGTTRRTLLFYDAQDLFKPVQVADNGYRYYDYDQLYELTFILELRKLGLSIKQIKDLLQAPKQAELDHELRQINQTIDQQMQRLDVLKQTLTQRFSQTPKSLKTVINQPEIISHSDQQFWCSIKSVTCTEKEISALYQDFYQKIGSLKLIDRRESGFMTKLPECNAEGYKTASFCIIKESNTAFQSNIPLVTRKTGKYVTINTLNTTADVCKSLEILHNFIQKHDLHIDQTLWQLNIDEHLANMAASKYMALEYQLLD